MRSPAARHGTHCCDIAYIIHTTTNRDTITACLTINCSSFPSTCEGRKPRFSRATRRLLSLTHYKSYIIVLLPSYWQQFKYSGLVSELVTNVLYSECRLCRRAFYVAVRIGATEVLAMRVFQCKTVHQDSYQVSFH